MTDSEDSDSEDEDTPPPHKPIRPAKAKATQKLAAAPDPTTPEKEDISGSDYDSSDYHPEEGGTGVSESDSDKEEHAPNIDPYEVLEELEGHSDDEDLGVDDDTPPEQADTEDEDDDVDEIRQNRRRNKGQLLEEIQRELAVSVTRPSIYVPDQVDQELIMKYIISPIMQDGKLITKYGDSAPETVIQMVMAGELPKRASKIQSALFTQTPTLYSRGLMDLLGLVQEDIILAGGADNRLVGGKLKLSQYFDFKGDNFLDLPENVKDLLNKMPSPNKRSHALSGFIHLLDSLDRYASTPAVFQKFLERYDFNS